MFVPNSGSRGIQNRSSCCVMVFHQQFYLLFICRHYIGSSAHQVGEEVKTWPALGQKLIRNTQSASNDCIGFKACVFAKV